jgi:hypothetical protein
MWNAEWEYGMIANSQFYDIWSFAIPTQQFRNPPFEIRISSFGEPHFGIRDFPVLIVPFALG